MQAVMETADAAPLTDQHIEKMLGKYARSRATSVAEIEGGITYMEIQQFPDRIDGFAMFANYEYAGRPAFGSLTVEIKNYVGLRAYAWLDDERTDGGSWAHVYAVNEYDGDDDEYLLSEYGSDKSPLDFAKEIAERFREFEDFEGAFNACQYDRLF